MTPTSTKPSVVFVCVANSCRSQMAEAIAKSVAKDRWEIWSAGSHPSGTVHPIAKTLMAEVGLDLNAHYSKGVAALPAQQWDCVVTMGCGDRCPTLRARQRVDWDIPDPVGRPLDEARRIRDRLAGLVRELLRTPTLDTASTYRSH